ncbi:MAG: rhomboid family intramembrane serine protease [Rhodocyclaceae bacterium]|nr:rhomboid family intramembrane serine protease [Rhodocyclaceae bacterium]
MGDRYWQVPAETLVRLGANYGPMTLNGQAWRLATALFLHGGILHLSLNMLALWQVGPLVELAFGRWRFLLIFFGAGWAASVASVWWQPAINSVGASGAIFGLIAALLVELPMQRQYLPRVVFHRLRASLLSFPAFSLVAGFVLPGIDNAAHLGGLLAGGLLGFALSPAKKGVRFWTSAQVGSGFLVAGLVMGGWLAIEPVPKVPNPERRFLHGAELDQVVARFAHEERELVMGQQLTLDGVRRGRIPRGELVRIIEEELLPRWGRQIELLALVSSQDDPRPELLRRYAGLRQESLQALLLGIQTRSEVWIATSARLTGQAQAVLLELGRGDVLNQGAGGEEAHGPEALTPTPGR